MTIKIRRTGSGITEMFELYATDDEFPHHPTGMFSGRVAGPMSFVNAVLEGMITENKSVEILQPPEDYAVRMRELYDNAENAIANKDADTAAYAAFELGRLYSEALMKNLWEDHALRGKGTVDAASEGGTSRWEVKGFKNKEAKLQVAIERKHKEKPELSYKRLRELVAAEFNCSDSTVKRYTTNPLKK